MSDKTTYTVVGTYTEEEYKNMCERDTGRACRLAAKALSPSWFMETIKKTVAITGQSYFVREHMTPKEVEAWFIKVGMPKVNVETLEIQLVN